MKLRDAFLIPFVQAAAFQLHTPASVSSSSVACPPSLADWPLRDIFIVAGQSNAVGVGHVHQLPAEYATVPGNLMVYPRKATDPDFKDWSNMALHGGVGAINSNKHFGPEIAFGHELAAEVYTASKCEKFGIMKVAAQGVGLYDYWNTDNWSESEGGLDDEDRAPSLVPRRNFSAPENPENAIGDPFALLGMPSDITGDLFDLLVQEGRKAISSEVCAGQHCNVKGLLWVQGEADAAKMEYAKLYGKRLKHLFKLVRETLNLPDLFILIAKLGTDSPKDIEPEQDLIRQAQMEFVKEQGPQHAAVVEVDGLEKGDDYVHYTANGQVELGKRFAARYVEYVRR